MATQWQIGDRIQARWQIYKILQGGMGTVYIVYDHEWREAFAAKTFQERFFASQEVRERFIQEAHTWINLDIHQYTVQARFVEVIGGRPFLFLEYVTGGDLSRWIGTSRLTPERALRFAVQFCHGMEYALSKGVKAHRDIKPANVLLTEDGTLKITDFGLAKVFDEPSLPGEADEGAAREGSGLFGWLGRRKKIAVPEADKPSGRMGLGLTRTGMGAGTVEYMAPEQFEDVKRVDVRADVYSFGVMLYEMVSGQLPFGGRPKVSQRELERRHRTQAPPSLRRWLPKGAERLEAIVQRCLRKEAEERYEDFVVLRRELVELYEGFTGESAPMPREDLKLSAIDWSNKGVALGKLGLYDETLACYDRALEIDPQFATVWSNKGAVLGDLGMPQEALTCHDRALAIDPQDATAWYSKSMALWKLGRLDEGLTCLDRALEIDPQFAMAWFNKGNALLGLGRPDEALSCFDRAVAIDPQLKDAWYNKGVVLGELGRYDEEIACYNRTLAVDPQFKGAWYNKGLALGALGRLTEALPCYDRVLAIDPQDAVAWFSKGNALGALGRPDEALACYDRALAIDPQYGDAWVTRGVTLRTLGRPDEALSCYDRALAIDPQLAMAWYSKGVTLGKLGRPDEALACLDRALEIDPQLAMAWYDKGVALGKLELYDEAFSCYDRALAIDPHFGDAWINKGNVLVRLGRLAEALPCYDRVLEIDPQDAKAWFNKGAALGNLRRYREALECFQRAQRLGDPQAAQGIAACLRDLGT